MDSYPSVPGPYRLDPRDARRKPPRSAADRKRVHELATLDPEALRDQIGLAGQDVATVQMGGSKTFQPGGPGTDVVPPTMITEAIAAQKAKRLGRQSSGGKV